MVTKKKKIERCSTSMMVQSIMFDRTKWTRLKARKWLQGNGYRSIKVDSGKNQLRYQQQDPENSCKGIFRLIKFGKGIKATLCCRK